MNKIFGINGFGRIGRTSLRAWWQYSRQESSLAVINTSGSMDIEGWAHLLKYDSNYGQFPAQIELEKTQGNESLTDENPVLGKLNLKDTQGTVHQVLVTGQKDPAKIPWGKYSVETVLESTGVFTSVEKATPHLTAGAKRVIISAPAKGEGVSTAVLGVNQLDVNNPIGSNASCTTNCVAPVAQVMVEKFGVEKAIMTTIHAYTDDQNTQDNSHKDLRRARSAAENIIPTTTGAAKTTAQIVPELKGLFDGLAIRVPVKPGSLSDIVFVTKRPNTVQEVHQVMTEASQ